MSASAEAIAFLLEEQDLRHLFQQWPQHMCLAVGLDPEGGCAMLVFHASEAERVLPRLARSMNWRADEFSVIPKIDGYQNGGCCSPTSRNSVARAGHRQPSGGRPRLRDQFRLCRRRGARPGNADVAKSASVSPALREVERLLSELNPTHSATSGAPPTSRNAASVPTDRAETTAPVSADGGPPGFRRLSDTHRAEALMATCELSLDADTVRITIDEAGADAQSFGVRDVISATIFAASPSPWRNSRVREQPPCPARSTPRRITSRPRFSRPCGRRR